MKLPRKKVLWTLAPSLFLLIAILVVYKIVNPAPPSHFVITTGDGEGDYQAFAKLYQDLIKDDGVKLEVRPSSGALENLARLQDPKSGVDAGFVPDGLGTTEDSPDLSSLGSIYYEPIWIFYRSGRGADLTRLSQLAGKRIALAHNGSGTHVLAQRLLNSSGIDERNAHFLSLAQDEATAALRDGTIDVAFFMATAEDKRIRAMVTDPRLRLMSLDQAEAITRQIPFLHHLVLPHGALDLKNNLPAQDVHLVSPTATLLVKDSLHPALAYLLLKAAAQVHGDPGIFEKRGEFPMNKDDQFPLSDEAKNFYKNGAPFWQRYLPFWLAILVERLILLALPMLALVLPVFRAIPKFQNWRIRSRIYQRYGELKFLETQLKPSHSESFADHLKNLDAIEERVNQMKVPLDYSDHIYVLREHIDFVRGRLERAKRH